MVEPVPEGWIWIRDAVREYGLAYRTLMRWCHSGALTKYRRIGDQRVYLLREELTRKRELHPVSPKQGPE